jgi:hypothetical protein
MEYRAWQLRFLQWLDTQASGSLINLCGGPWGKTYLAKINQDPNISYYHSANQLTQIQEDLQNGKKVVLMSVGRVQEVEKDFADLAVETYEIEAKEDTNDYLKMANEYEFST